MGSKDWQRPRMRKLRRWLGIRFPLDFPVRCYILPAKKMVDEDGTTLLGEFRPRFDAEGRVVRGIIVISDECGPQDILDILIEEWTHARTIPEHGFRGDPHTHAFMKEYWTIMLARRELAAKRGVLQ